jgi:transposase InsO family protein
MKYAFIKRYQTEYSVELMCKALKISRSSYADWLLGKHTKRREYKKVMQKRITEVYFEHRQRYGSPRIASELRSRGVMVSEQTVAKYMNLMRIRSKRAKKYTATTDSKHSNGYFDNILDRRFNEQFTSGAWVSDITYIPVIGGFLYQTVIIDLADRKVIGWSNSNGMTAEETTLEAFRMAIANRPPREGLIFHSDRGVQYSCKDFVNGLAKYKIVQSMSRKGNCWDNAVAESYFKTLKSELIYGNKTVSKQEMKSILFEYVEIYYNQKRRHSALGNLTIKEFENKYKNVA